MIAWYPLPSTQPILILIRIIRTINNGIKVYQFDNDIDDTILINFTTKLANDISVGSSSSDSSVNRRGIIARVYDKAIASRGSFKSPRRLRER